MRFCFLRAVSVTLLLTAPTMASAEGMGGMYEGIYGDPVDVRVRDLAFGGSIYVGRAIRTKGRIEIDMRSNVDLRSPRYLLQDEGYRILILPRPEVATAFEFEGMPLMGSRVELVGVFETNTTDVLPGVESSGRLEFWSWVVLSDDKRKQNEARSLSLEQLVTNIDRYRDTLVRVVGEFRGRNLYGDLPAHSLRKSTDWVIYEEPYSVWITDHKPQGRGWSLNNARKKDTGKWLVVTGRPEVVNDFIYIRATQVALTSIPRPRARPVSKTAPMPSASPPMPPVVVFSLPLDGEAGIPPSSVFAVQFSKDMDVESFRGRVLLRYAGSRRQGDHPFESLSLRYDAGRRVLRIDPGDVLRPGRDLEILLLPGIRDKDGLDLAVRSGRENEGAVDILKYRTGT